MVIIGVVALWTVIVATGWIAWRMASQHERAYTRLAEGTTEVTGEHTAAHDVRSDIGTTGLAGTPEGAAGTSIRGTRRLARRWIWVPWAFGIALALTIWILTGWPVQYLLAIGAVAALLSSQLESFFFTQHVAKLETQLADSIDIMVGALSAGAAVGPAIDAATQEMDAPLKPYLVEISGRIRLGDAPVEVFRSLADRVTLETFLLFSSALAVHWEVGGRLAPTLASVGRTIRDRIDVTRRIQSNIAQSQFSTFAIIGLIYLIAVIVWRNGPEPMQEFVTSRVGSWFVAGSIMLQAVGIAWMNIISKPRF